jgi:hypothetical protein
MYDLITNLSRNHVTENVSNNEHGQAQIMQHKNLNMAAEKHMTIQITNTPLQQ